MMAVFRWENDKLQYSKVDVSIHLILIFMVDEDQPARSTSTRVLEGFGWFWHMTSTWQFLKEIVKSIAVEVLLWTFPSSTFSCQGCPGDAQGMPRGETAKLSRGCLELPSGYVKIAIKNGHRNSGFTMIYPLNMVMFHSFLCMFTRVYSVMAGLGRVRVFFFRGSQCGFLRQESERFFPAGLSIQIVPDRFAIHQAQDFSLAGRYSWRRTCAKWRRDQRSGLDGLRPSKDNICGYLVDSRSVNWIWLIPVAISTLELVNLCIV